MTAVRAQKKITNLHIIRRRWRRRWQLLKFNTTSHSFVSSFMNPFVFVWRFFFSSLVFVPLSQRCCSTTSCDHRTRTQHKIQLQNHSTASSTSTNTMELFAWDYDSTAQLHALVVVDDADDNDVMIQNEKKGIKSTVDFSRVRSPPSEQK